MTDVIIIGAGAAGLMAAKQLSAAGLKVTVLEARERTGGRIFSFSRQPADFAIEGGAEFIHGNLEVTLKLLEEAGLQKQELAEGVWQVTKGQWKQENDFFEHAEAVIAKLKELTEDMSMADFIEKFFAADEYEKLRIALSSYIEGYYSAEVSNISALSFLKEWMSEDEQQYRSAGGYGKMIDYLADSSKKCGAVIQLSTIVKEIKWREGRVDITDETGKVYTSKKALITVPLGVWTVEENAKGAISYIPALPSKLKAAKQMGFGAVIKVLLYFKEPFWHDHKVAKSANADTRNFHMAISDMAVPTWWTQMPNELSLLTGWLSGPKAEQMKNDNDETILQQALVSVSSIFNMDVNSLLQKLQWSQIFNWTSDPFTRGSYSYSTLHTSKARSVVLEPEKDTLFFAGEALYDGPEMGTVEAALISGKEVAEKIINI